MIEVDTKLMCDFKLMDYSLLFAIEKIPRALRKRFSTKISRNYDFLETSSTGQFSDKQSKSGLQSEFSQTASSVSSLQNRHRYISSCGKYIYHLALIDYLQEFNFEKRGESKLKIWVLRRPATLISAVEPNLYRERFIQFMKSELLITSNLFLADESYQQLNDDFKK